MVIDHPPPLVIHPTPRAVPTMVPPRLTLTTRSPVP